MAKSVPATKNADPKSRSANGGTKKMGLPTTKAAADVSMAKKSAGLPGGKKGK